jgi:hypothetical protein
MSDTRATVTPPRRSKRATRERKHPDISDEKDESSNCQPSLAKKSRTRAVPKSKKLKSTKAQIVESMPPLSSDRQAITQDNNTTEYGEASNLNGTKFHSVAQGSRTTSEMKSETYAI